MCRVTEPRGVRRGGASALEAALLSGSKCGGSGERKTPRLEGLGKNRRRSPVNRLRFTRTHPGLGWWARIRARGCREPAPPSPAVPGYPISSIPEVKDRALLACTPTSGTQKQSDNGKENESQEEPRWAPRRAGTLGTGAASKVRGSLDLICPEGSFRAHESLPVVCFF